MPKLQLDITDNITYNITMEKSKRKDSQQLIVRIPKSLHESLKKHAEAEKVTLNQFCLYLLARGIGEKKV